MVDGVKKFSDTVLRDNQNISKKISGTGSVKVTLIVEGKESGYYRAADERVDFGVKDSIKFE